MWLFTHGRRRGLIKRIGEALTQHATGRATDLVAVCISPLGVLEHKIKLTAQEIKHEVS